MNSKLIVVSAVSVVTLSGCGLDDPTASTVRANDASITISDAIHGNGTAGFYFLPPVVSAPVVAGTFDADIIALNPAVAICDLNLGENIDCGGTTPAAVVFTTSSVPSIAANTIDGFYHVNWNTKGPEFEGGHIYRIHVYAGAEGARRELGFVDVLLSENPGQAKNTSTGDVIVLNDGQTLPIKFRIETNIVGSIAIALDPAEVRTGESSEAIATLTDLHGQPFAGAAVSWSAQGVPVTLAHNQSSTTVNGAATVTVTAGTTAGAATIKASSSGLSANAVLTLIPASINETTVLASMNHPRQALVAAAVGGKLYAVTGWSEFGGLANTNEEYDPTTNQWTYRVAAPTARWYAAAAVVNGIIYVMGGASNIGCCDGKTVVEAYDPATDTWTTKTPMPAARYQFAAASHDGLIYTFGGLAPGFTSTVYVYDPATDTWSTRTPMPAPRSGHAVAMANNKFYIVGGENSALFQTPVFEYDPVTDTWDTKAPIPHGRAHLGAAAVDGIVYAVGGYNVFGFTSIDAFDPVTNTWTPRAPLHISRFFLGVAALNGVVYAVGGVNQVNSVPELEGYRP